MGIDRGCPWMTAADRCLGHVGGTAGEDDAPRSVAATVTSSAKGRGPTRTTPAPLARLRRSRGSSALVLPSTAGATVSPLGATLRLLRPTEQALQLSGQPAEARVIRLTSYDAVAIHDHPPLRSLSGFMLP